MASKLSSRSRAVRYREMGYRLWRISTDRRRDISFELRSKLAQIADDLEGLADRLEDEFAFLYEAAEQLRAIADGAPSLASELRGLADEMEQQPEDLQ